jgi:hypothetical protein
MLKKQLLMVAVVLAGISFGEVAHARGRSSCPGGVCPNAAAPTLAVAETTEQPAVAAAAQPTRKLATNMRSLRLRRNG